MAGCRAGPQRIRDAGFVELPGSDHQAWVGAAEPVLAALEEFLTGGRGERVSRSVLGTLPFTDIVGSTQTAALLGDRDLGRLAPASPSPTAARTR